MLYLISFDLARPGHKKLIATLKAMNATQLLPSQWILDSCERPLDIRSRLTRKGKLRVSDRLLVSGVTGDTAWRNLLVDDASAAQVLNVEDDDASQPPAASNQLRRTGSQRPHPRR